MHHCLAFSRKMKEDLCTDVTDEPLLLRKNRVERWAQNARNRFCIGTLQPGLTKHFSFCPEAEHARTGELHHSILETPLEQMAFANFERLSFTDGLDLLRQMLGAIAGDPLQLRGGRLVISTAHLGGYTVNRRVKI